MAGETGLSGLTGLSGIFTAGGTAISPPPPPTLLFHDSFTDMDGTELSVHTPDFGSAWENLFTDTGPPGVTTFGVVSDRCETALDLPLHGHDAQGVYVTDLGVTFHQGTMLVNDYHVSPDGVGVSVRHVSADPFFGFYFAQIDTSPGAAPFNPFLYYWDETLGYINLAYAAGQADRDTDYILEWSLDANFFTCNLYDSMMNFIDTASYDVSPDIGYGEDDTHVGIRSGGIFRTIDDMFVYANP